MSNAQNLAYAAIQVVHNFGAVATVAGSVAATRYGGIGNGRKLARLVLAGWGTQAASGAAFGITSYLFYHHFPDIAGIAIAALIIKIACAATGFLGAAAYLMQGASWPEKVREVGWYLSSALAVTALSAAAFLRWFS